MKELLNKHLKTLKKTPKNTATHLRNSLCDMGIGHESFWHRNGNCTIYGGK